MGRRRRRRREGGRVGEDTDAEFEGSEVERGEGDVCCYYHVLD